MTDEKNPRHPLDMNGKPMHDWYYTRDGLCRPVPCGNAPAEAYKDYCEFLAERLEAAHGYADECEAKIKFLHQQIDQILAAAKQS